MSGCRAIRTKSQECAQSVRIPIGIDRDKIRKHMARRGSHKAHDKRT